MAAEKGQLGILCSPCEWVKWVLTPEDLNNKIFVAKDICGRTAWYVAAQNGKVQLFQQQWELARKIFLTKDNFGRAAWHMAAENVHI